MYKKILTNLHLVNSYLNECTFYFLSRLYVRKFDTGTAVIGDALAARR